MHEEVGGVQGGLEQGHQHIQQRRAAALGVEVEVPRQVHHSLFRWQLHPSSMNSQRIRQRRESVCRNNTPIDSF